MLVIKFIDVALVVPIVSGPGCPPLMIKLPTGEREVPCLTTPKPSIVSKKSVVKDVGLLVNLSAGPVVVLLPTARMAGLLALPFTVSGTPEVTVITVAPLMVNGLPPVPMVVKFPGTSLIRTWPIICVVLNALPIVVGNMPVILMFVEPVMMVCPCTVLVLAPDPILVGAPEVPMFVAKKPVALIFVVPVMTVVLRALPMFVLLVETPVLILVVPITVLVLLLAPMLVVPPLVPMLVVAPAPEPIDVVATPVVLMLVVPVTLSPPPTIVSAVPDDGV